MQKYNKKISIELTQDEALIFFDMMKSSIFTKIKEVLPSEAYQLPLLTIETELEQILTEPFRDDYDEIIEKVKKKVLDELYDAS